MGAASWGRVADDGSVYVRVGDGEREVGQYPEGTPAEALAFFVKRYEALEFEVRLLEQRVRSGAVGPEEANTALSRLLTQVDQANAVGDLHALTARLEALRPLLGVQREQRREDRARRTEEARQRKEHIVAEAERIAEGRDWRNGANRLRDLLGEWKQLPRLDRGADDALWHRFSGARTAYTKARKAHFAQMSERREGARAVKERLVREAQALADSTEWGPTSGKLRRLMQDWKAAGPAPREVDDRLWAKFRAAQDTFFAARDAANAEQDQEFAANAETKQELLAQAEALLPIRDVDAAKRAFRDIAERWDAVGKVPRDQIRSLEGRLRKVEQAVRDVEQAQWRRSDPEKSARADDVVGKLEAGIEELEAKLEQARATGDATVAADTEADLEARRAFLAAARKAASDFSA